MTKRILIIGGYGNFGSFISKILVREENLHLIIAGRNLEKANALISRLEGPAKLDSAQLDIHQNLSDVLANLRPDIVIHTSGPYQGQSYFVAEQCIKHGCNYIDLADARDFVSGISALNEKAKQRSVLVCSGASSVPCLSSAIIDKYINEFEELQSVEYAITTAQKTNRGLATTASVLSYAGKPIQTLIDGQMQNVYGWLGLKWRRFWGLNLRSLGNCDVPDLELFPERYPNIKTIRFRAGLELKLLHLCLWAMSGLVKLRVLPSLQPLAPLLLKVSFLFDIFGKDDSGFYIDLSGVGKDGKEKTINFDLVARKGDGLHIPIIPAILMAKKLANEDINTTGAQACVGLISLDEYLGALSEFDIEWQVI